MAEVLHHDNHGHDDHHHDDTDITVFGFWTYLMSDLVIFGTLFIAFAVLSSHVPVGTPTAKDLFGESLGFVLTETFALLISSVTFGFAVLAAYKKDVAKVLTWLGVTWVFGAIFIGMELYEFNHLVHAGHGPSTSAFLSAFFTLVGTHGIHVTSGLVWMIVLMVQIKKYGLTIPNMRRLACLSLFWHFLDIVWICVFSVVYLMGVL
ncbi:cytochrome o ubiquinol oxidase subunit III [Acinetobacter towneri]|uniref:cytochrome o ubiquinol oxidase subunit III n=1 Tax=Acinetobacter TaxID=469 RepID=UPI000BDCD75C|nr:MULTISPECIES: cytochrome o ubiquinol oxidase subunit III [Acinetobacter]MCO8053573.1 cytochrome o ubiquinol oxidase subunit III [Acinetobacter towneri]MCO8055863.1 cytochrome o ubiquinol oxidase subunit III [Acinetobacter towneri]MDD4852518.1 cytochrome o ubiquinol oxidase subunit III [Acinetobacter towneri]MDM1720364.1 cytochrome o ubiquinol oxidase subunit III [Acinetobacter towneri]MDV2483363.1 cytochrome o ubiquinol oxidase subunit III [Acinetobacter towneri]